MELRLGQRVVSLSARASSCRATSERSAYPGSFLAAPWCQVFQASWEALSYPGLREGLAWRRSREPVQAVMAPSVRAERGLLVVLERLAQELGSEPVTQAEVGPVPLLLLP